MAQKKYSYEFPRPMVTVDAVVFSPAERCLEVLVIRRKNAPFKGSWALPGGFVEMGEPLKEAAARELAEETGIRAVQLEQVHTFGDPGRDPRGQTISIGYMALIDRGGYAVKAGDDAAALTWLPVTDLPRLAFDHNSIVEYALVKLRTSLRYKGVGVQVLPETFTLRELRSLYEAILGEPIDARLFRRKIAALNILEGVTNDRGQGRRSRPGRYRFGKGRPEPA